jgi:hypothetical protein
MMALEEKFEIALEEEGELRGGAPQAAWQVGVQDAMVCKAGEQC